MLFFLPSYYLLQIQSFSSATSFQTPSIPFCLLMWETKFYTLQTIGKFNVHVFIQELVSPPILKKILVNFPLIYEIWGSHDSEY